MPFLHYKNGNSWINGVDIFYPVGAIYMSTNETSPADLFGGTWAALDDGKFLRPMGSYNEQGGAVEHWHRETVGFNAGETNLYVASGWNFTSSMVYYGPKVAVIHKNIPNVSGNIYGESTKATDAFRNNWTFKASSLPSYRTIYCWIRTA